MIRYAIALLLAACFFLSAAPNAEAGYAFPVAGAPFRVGARVLKGAARVALAPARLANRVRVNRLEARAHRGNPLAAARLESTQARMHGRACH
jgi:hypothetical protein